MFQIIGQRVFPAIKAMKNGVLPDISPQGDVIEAAGDAVSSHEETAFARYMGDAMFLIPTPQLLQKVVTGIEDLFQHDLENKDVQGDLYEYMLGKLSTAGRNGQFRTPLQIRNMMVQMMKPNPEDLICDPSCGTAGFLVSAAEYIRSHYDNNMTDEQRNRFAAEAEKQLQ